MTPANDTTHPNVTAMKAAVERWIKEAATKPNPATALAERVQWLERQSAILSGPGQTPAHLDGLGAWDIGCAICQLVAASQAARAARFAKAA